TAVAAALGGRPTFLGAAGAAAVAVAAGFLRSAEGVDFVVGTGFTFGAAAGLEGAAAVLVAAGAAFNGFFAAADGLADTAGFFELGIRPRYNKNEQAESHHGP